MNTLDVTLDPQATLPVRAHPEDAGLDLCAKKVAYSVQIGPGLRVFFDTGIHVAIPHGHVGLVCDRSGLAKKNGLTVLGGVIDSGYRGSIGVVLLNTNLACEYNVQPGEKIAQLLIVPIALLTPRVVDSLDPAGERGTAGFGSTGRTTNA